MKVGGASGARVRNVCMWSERSENQGSGRTRAAIL